MLSKDDDTIAKLASQYSLKTKVDNEINIDSDNDSP